MHQRDINISRKLRCRVLDREGFLKESRDDDVFTYEIRNYVFYFIARRLFILQAFPNGYGDRVTSTHLISFILVSTKFLSNVAVGSSQVASIW